MPPPEDPQSAGRPEPSAEERRRRRQRLADVFGEVLPSQTSDDLDPSTDEAEGDHEAWLRRQVPPHHG